ncbi:MAG: ABC transporter substrate-binding protein [Ignisphaera sp.]
MVPIPNSKLFAKVLLGILIGLLGLSLIPPIQALKVKELWVRAEDFQLSAIDHPRSGTIPATINWNPFASGGILGGAARGFCHNNLFAILDAEEGIIFPFLARSFSVNLKEGYMDIVLWGDEYWFNGERFVPIVAKDLWTYFIIQWKIFRNFIPWLKDVLVINDTAIRIVFNSTTYIAQAPLINDPSKSFKYEFKSSLWYYGVPTILSQAVTTPYEIFGKYAEKVADVPVGEIPKVFDLTSLQNEVRNLFIDKPWCNGVYWPDPTKITPAQIVWYVNPGSRWKKYLPSAADQLIIHLTAAEAQMVEIFLKGSILTSGYQLSPFSAITVDQQSTKTRIAYVYEYRVTGMWINFMRYPLNITEVRQALALLTNVTAAALAYPAGYMPFKDYITGQSSSEWFADWIKNNLYDWSYNPQKAYQLLEKAGFKRGSDGKWYDTKTGQPLKVSILVRSDYPDLVTICNNVVDQWKQHGIDAALEAVTSAVLSQRRDAWDFDITGELYLVNTKGPMKAFDGYFTRYGYLTNYAYTKLNFTWSLPLKNGTLIYINPSFENAKLQAAFPGTKGWWEALSSMVWFWNYYVLNIPISYVSRTRSFNIIDYNWAEILGKPDSWIEVQGYKFPYYGPPTKWTLHRALISEGGWGGGPPSSGYSWLFYGVLKKPSKPDRNAWPGTNDPPDLISLLPSEVRKYTVNFYEVFVKPALAELPVTPTTTPTTTPVTTPKPTTPPSPTPTTTPTIIPGAQLVTVTTTVVSTIERTTLMLSTTTTEVKKVDWTWTIVLPIVLFIVGLPVGFVIKKK